MTRCVFSLLLDQRDVFRGTMWLYACLDARVYTIQTPPYMSLISIVIFFSSNRRSLWL